MKQSKIVIEVTDLNGYDFVVVIPTTFKMYIHGHLMFIQNIVKCSTGVAFIMVNADNINAKIKTRLIRKNVSANTFYKNYWKYRMPIPNNNA